MQKLKNLINSLTYWGLTLSRACQTMVIRTKVRQWRKVAAAGTPPWDERNQTLASFIPAGSSVLDIGCGAQSLKQHLAPSCRYQPSDIIKSTPEVILCDLNGGIYPKTEEHFDYVVCSGVFEYMRRPREFLEKLSTYGQKFIMTYNPLYPGDLKLKRMGDGLGWVNHLGKAELESLLNEMGLQWHILHIDQHRCVIYCIEGRGVAPGK